MIQPAGGGLERNAMLRADNAAVALLQLADRRYVLQLRDQKPTIFYPDHWGCFGGAIEPGERPVDAVVRELREELGIEIAAEACSYFTEFTFDFGFVGRGVLSRIYYSVVLDQVTLDGLQLGEGAALQAFEGRVALDRLRLVPYDAFALFMHLEAFRLN